MQKYAHYFVLMDGKVEYHDSNRERTEQVYLSWKEGQYYQGELQEYACNKIELVQGTSDLEMHYDWSQARMLRKWVKGIKNR